MDDAKRSIALRLGARINTALGGDSALAATQALGERRLQTWLLSLVTLILSSLAVYVVCIFAGLPGQVDRLSDKVTALSLDSTLSFAQLSRRVDASAKTDARHDADLWSLTRRVDRVEYVLDVAPATADYARSAHVPRTKTVPEAKPSDD